MRHVARRLLAAALSAAAGKPYPDLLAERVQKPLGLTDTSFAPAADGRGWKYFAPVKFCASNAEPRTAPELSTSRLPLA